jgi:hypothetical protein
MPFTYKVTIKGNDLREDTIVLDSWVYQSFRTRLSRLSRFYRKYLMPDGVIVYTHDKLMPGQVFAYAHDKLGKIKLLANGDAFLLKKIAKTGQKICPDDTIAEFGADGENIPYGKPYCTVEYQ